MTTSGQKQQIIPIVYSTTRIPSFSLLLRSLLSYVDTAIMYEEAIADSNKTAQTEKVCPHCGKLDTAEALRRKYVKPACDYGKHNLDVADQHRATALKCSMDGLATFCKKCDKHFCYIHGEVKREWYKD
eukprot:gene18452-5927_t